MHAGFDAGLPLVGSLWPPDEHPGALWMYQQCQQHLADSASSECRHQEECNPCSSTLASWVKINFVWTPGSAVSTGCVLPRMPASASTWLPVICFQLKAKNATAPSSCCAFAGIQGSSVTTQICASDLHSQEAFQVLPECGNTVKQAHQSILNSNAHMDSLSVQIFTLHKLLACISHATEFGPCSNCTTVNVRWLHECINAVVTASSKCSGWLTCGPCWHSLPPDWSVAWHTPACLQKQQCAEGCCLCGLGHSHLHPQLPSIVCKLFAGLPLRCARPCKGAMWLCQLSLHMKGVR